MRLMVLAVVAIALVAGAAPGGARAASEGPAGVPLLYYVVHEAAQPPGSIVAPSCTPDTCPPDTVVLYPVVIVLNPIACSPASFATETEADQFAAQQTPAGEWYVVQAPDVPHALAHAGILAITTQNPAWLPFMETTDYEDSLAATYARLCAGATA